MNKISNTIVGIPLKQTGPAAVEKFLVDKVRSDLGDAAEFVTIRPVLRVDTEDGDLSGNITHAFGNIELDVKGVKFYLPFIIQDKNLIPFDVIRLGDQEVPYDIGKLQKLAFALKQKVESQADSSDGEIAEVVDFKDIPTHNGFLGTIMDIRDSHRATDATGAGLWDGLEFGHLDDERMMKRASANVDVAEVFSDVSEKLASAEIYKESVVDGFLETVEKEAFTKAVEQVKTAETMPDTAERVDVRREFKKLDDDKLVGINRVKSGNNIVFPLLDQGQFEYRPGRVYHKLVTATGDSVNSGFAAVVLDNKKEYSMLKTTEKFMTTLQEADRFFEPATVEAKSMAEGSMYSYELEEDTLVHPFTISYSQKQSEVRNGIVISVPERAERGKNPSKSDYCNSIFEDVICARYVGVKGNKDVCFFIMQDESFKGPSVITRDELETMIVDVAKDNIDLKRANMFISSHYAEEYILMSKHHKVYPMKKRIEGSFQKPTGYLDHMNKVAAYEQADKVTLYVKKDSRPRMYDIKWTYTDMVDSPDGKAQYKIQTKNMNSLSEDSARQTLQLLGFDMRRIEQFFEITKRNGRSATFNLPSKQKAQNTTPEDIAKEQRKKKFQGLANHTLNANNFMPIFENMVSGTLSSFISSAAPSVPGKIKEWDDFLKTSFETARDIEKVANELSGPNWFELAMMTNMKYQLDKMAHEISKGSFVKLDNETLEKVASVKGHIADATNELIQLNRLQLTKHARPVVKPALVKQAISQLEGLYAYAHFNEKLNGGIEKEAGLFNSKQIKEIGDVAETKKRELGNLMKQFQEANIELRAFKNSPKPSQTKQTSAQVKVDSIKGKIEQKETELNSILDNKSSVEQNDYKKTSGAMVGLSSLAMAGLGAREASKNRGE